MPIISDLSSLTQNEIDVLKILADGEAWDHDNLIRELGIDIDAPNVTSADYAHIDAALNSLHERSYIWGGLFHCCISEAGSSVIADITRDVEIDPLALVYAGLGDR